VPHLFYYEERVKKSFSTGGVVQIDEGTSSSSSLWRSPMAEHWIHTSENILKKIETFLEQEPKDRLERITAILFPLNVLDMSLHAHASCFCGI
jgi:hypothetical protein